MLEIQEYIKEQLQNFNDINNIKDIIKILLIPSRYFKIIETIVTKKEKQNILKENRKKTFDLINKYLNQHINKEKIKKEINNIINSFDYEKLLNSGIFTYTNKGYRNGGDFIITYFDNNFIEKPEGLLINEHTLFSLGFQKNYETMTCFLLRNLFITQKLKTFFSKIENFKMAKNVLQQDYYKVASIFVDNLDEIKIYENFYENNIVFFNETFYEIGLYFEEKIKEKIKQVIKNKKETKVFFIDGNIKSLGNYKMIHVATNKKIKKIIFINNFAVIESLNVKKTDKIKYKKLLEKTTSFLPFYQKLQNIYSDLEAVNGSFKSGNKTITMGKKFFCFPNKQVQQKNAIKDYYKNNLNELIDKYLDLLQNNKEIIITDEEAKIFDNNTIFNDNFFKEIEELKKYLINLFIININKQKGIQINRELAIQKINIIFDILKKNLINYFQKNEIYFIPKHLETIILKKVIYIMKNKYLTNIKYKDHTIMYLYKVDKYITKKIEG